MVGYTSNTYQGLRSWKNVNLNKMALSSGKWMEATYSMKAVTFCYQIKIFALT